MTEKGNPAVLDHDGIENEPASTATLSESAEKADGQNDCPSRGLNHHEIRAYIDSMLGKPDEAAAGEPDPDDLAETDRAEKDFGELSESLAGEPVPDSLRAAAHQDQRTLNREEPTKWGKWVVTGGDSWLGYKAQQRLLTKQEPP